MNQHSSLNQEPVGDQISAAAGIKLAAFRTCVRH